jgi:hypothetical protein
LRGTASRPAPRMIPDQERRSSVAKAEASATHCFGLESGGQSDRATRGLPPLCTVGAAEFAPPASGKTALFSTAIEFAVFSSPLPDVADPVVVQLVSGFSLEGVVDCAAAGPMTNVPARIAVAARSIFVSMAENCLLNSIQEGTRNHGHGSIRTPLAWQPGCIDAMGARRSHRSIARLATCALCNSARRADRHLVVDRRAACRWSLTRQQRTSTTPGDSSNFSKR